MIVSGEETTAGTSWREPSASVRGGTPAAQKGSKLRSSSMVAMKAARSPAATSIGAQGSPACKDGTSSETIAAERCGRSAAGLEMASGPSIHRTSCLTRATKSHRSEKTATGSYTSSHLWEASTRSQTEAASIHPHQPLTALRLRTGLIGGFAMKTRTIDSMAAPENPRKAYS